MDDTRLADLFEQHRARLRAVAYRMLGSATDAEDAVQETWLRLSGTSAADIDNIGGWLTTVVARICLDTLRARRSRPEDPIGDLVPEPSLEDAIDPEREAVLADAVGPALLVVLDTLSPSERLAFVLHDMFGVPFEEIAAIAGRTPAAARQLASRARRRVQGAEPAEDADASRRREIVDAFLAASRDGDFEGLLALLDPDVVARSDVAAVQMGSPAETTGATAVAKFFAGRARAARPGLVDGEPGLVWAQGGVARVAFAFTIEDGTIVEIELIADSERLTGVEAI